MNFQINTILVVARAEKESRRFAEVSAVLFPDARLSIVTNAGEANAAVTSQFFDILVVGALQDAGDSIELIKSLTAREPDVPIIFIHNSRTENSVSEAIRAGAADFLSIENLTTEMLHHCVWSVSERSFRNRNQRFDYTRMKILSRVSNEASAIVEQGNVIYANDAFFRMFGYDPREVVGFPLAKFVADENRVSRSNRRTDGSEWFCEAAGLKKNGERLDIAYKKEACLVSGRKTLVCVIRENHEKKSLEYALAGKDRFFEVLLKNSREITVICTRTGVIQYCSPSVGRQMGVESANLVGTNVFDRVHEDDFKDLLNIFRSRKNRPLSFQSLRFRIRHASGHWRWFEAGASNLLSDPDIRGIVINAHDITEKLAAERKLSRSRARVELMLRESSDAVWDWDIESGTLFCSERFGIMMGAAPGSSFNTWRDLEKNVHEAEQETFRSALWKHLHQDTPFELEVRLRKHDSHSYGNFVIKGNAVKDAAGRPVYMAGALTDITRRKKAEARVIHNLLHDFLTGLPGRELLLQRLNRCIEYMQANDKFEFSVLSVDLDSFRNVNEGLGHRSGDDVLIEFTRRMLNHLRASDLLARAGADEFFLVLDNCHADNAVRCAIEINRALQAPFRFDGSEVYLKASIGIAGAEASVKSPEEYLRNAHAAMLRAKKQGSSRYAVYNLNMGVHALHKLQLESELRRALQNDEFRLHYQPIIDLSSGGITGFEALVRWQHPERGLSLPGEFIHIAEESGLIVPLGEWVLNTACGQNRKWQEAGYDPLRASVNFSVEQFKNSDVHSMVKKALSASGMAPESLDVEVTESVAMSSPDLIIRMLRKLSDMGVNISIDDFGTGHSSLGRLKYYPNHTLKIDRTFIHGLSQGNKDSAIVSAIIDLGQQLELNLVAEGVETGEQLSFLKSRRCNEAQGYLFSRPVPEEEFENILKDPGVIRALSEKSPAF